jgi:uncharacterized HhH-GPD family protein
VNTRLQLTQDADADALLSDDPFALVVGMLLDQQMPMERAFLGPAKLRQRLGSLDPAAIAAMDADDFVALCAQPPAVHRYPAAMGARIHALATYVRDKLSGDTAALWRDAPDGAALRRRVQELPGYGPQKAQILVALLGKQLEVTPTGWREAAGPYGEPDVYRSVADVVDSASLAMVRADKQERKAAARSARDGGQGAQPQEKGAPSAGRQRAKR